MKAVVFTQDYGPEQISNDKTRCICVPMFPPVREPRPPSGISGDHPPGSCPRMLANWAYPARTPTARGAPSLSWWSLHPHSSFPPLHRKTTWGWHLLGVGSALTWPGCHVLPPAPLPTLPGPVSGPLKQLGAVDPFSSCRKRAQGSPEPWVERLQRRLPTHWSSLLAGEDAPVL